MGEKRGEKERDRDEGGYRGRDRDNDGVKREREG